MSVSKVRITEEFAKDLRELRKEYRVDGKELSAQALSYAIGKPRCWMNQLESPNKNGKKFVKTIELNLIFEKLLGKDYYNSDEYRNFMARHAENVPTDHVLWQSHKSFSISPHAYAAVDYEKAFRSALMKFNETFKHLTESTNNDERRFMLLRSLNMLNRNLMSVPDLAVILNTTPLFTCEGHAAFSHNVTKHMLSLIDECIDYLRKEPESYNPYEMSWAKTALTDALACVEKAISTLKAMLDNENPNELRKAYNEHVREINSICEVLYFPHAQVPPIEDYEQVDIALIGDRIKAIGSTEKKLTILLDRIRSEYERYDEWAVSQMIEESTAEYQEGHYQGMLPEQWEVPSLPDDDQTTEQNDDTETQNES